MDCFFFFLKESLRNKQFKEVPSLSGRLEAYYRKKKIVFMSHSNTTCPNKKFSEGSKVPMNE